MSTKIQIKVESYNFLRIYLINIDIFTIKIRICLETTIQKTSSKHLCQPLWEEVIIHPTTAIFLGNEIVLQKQPYCRLNRTGRAKIVLFYELHESIKQTMSYYFYCSQTQFTLHFQMYIYYCHSQRKSQNINCIWHQFIIHINIYLNSSQKIILLFCIHCIH